MSLSPLFPVFIVLLLFMAAWYLLGYCFTPRMDNPDGYARVTGSCGDTMEIGLKFERGRVVKTHCWTNGCSLSAQCVESAARLALDREAAEIRTVNLVHIMEQIGTIPETHIHCAQLAETTLQRAVDQYLRAAEPASSGTAAAT